MSKIKIGSYEIDSESLIMGAVAATGLTCICLGIKSFFDARRLKFIAGQPEDEEAEFEEYRRRKQKRLAARHARKVRNGIFGVTFGGLIAAIGIISYTPYKEYVFDSDIVRRLKDTDIPDRVREADIVRNVTKLTDSLDKIKDLSEKLGVLQEVL